LEVIQNNVLCVYLLQSTTARLTLKVVVKVDFFKLFERVSGEKTYLRVLYVYLLIK